MNEKLIKTKKRVKDYGEVFTPEWLVKDMCDLVPTEIWDDINKTFLEPACGNGNFLVEIFDRKLKRCKTPKDGLKALNSIFGIDIQADNIEESKERLFNMYCKAFPTASWFSLATAGQILHKRIICGDSLEIMAQWEKEMKNEPIQISLFDN